MDRKASLINYSHTEAKIANLDKGVALANNCQNRNILLVEICKFKICFISDINVEFDKTFG